MTDPNAVITAMTISIDCNLGLDGQGGIEPSFGVSIAVHDAEFAELTQDPELIPEWLRRVADDIERQIRGGNVAVRPDETLEPVNEAAMKQLRDVATQRRQDEEAEALVSIMNAAGINPAAQALADKDSQS